MPTAITTSTADTATAYSNQRKVDRTSNGVLWAWDYVGSAGGARARESHSLDNGATWTTNENVGFYLYNGNVTQNYVPNFSIFIDQDDYAHAVYKNLQDGFIYYRRGTPNAGRTAWTWSAATTVYSSNVYGDYPDIVAFSLSGTQYVAIAHSENRGPSGSSINYVYARLYTVDGTGALTYLTGMLGGNYSVMVHTYPSIDFNHTGDGKTVAGSTPHLYVSWSAGATGAGKGIRFRKATYTAGPTWTWGSEREIDSTRYVANFNYWINCMFDGTRVIIPGFLTSGSDNALVFHERDAADTTTTLRALLVGSAEADRTFVGSATYDGSGNIYVLGRTSGTANGSMTLAYRKWVRETDTLESPVAIESSAPTNLYASAKRGYSNNLIEFIYTDGTSSPYSVTYGQIELPSLSPYVPMVML